jgi:hypothetical protein
MCIKRQVVDVSFIPMVMFTKESGSMIRLMVVGPTFTWMEHNTLVNGERINSTDSELKLGLMVLNMKVIMNMERNMEPVLSNGLMDPCTSESFITTTSTAREFIPGQTAVSTRENGATTRCMEREPSLGQMVASMLVSTLMIRNKVTESSSGLTADATRATGKEVSNTARVCTSLARAMRSMENGKTASAFVGLERKALSECSATKGRLRAHNERHRLRRFNNNKLAELAEKSLK